MAVETRSRRAVCRAWGRDSVAASFTLCALLGRESRLGGFTGSAIWHRSDATILSCEESASPMVLRLERKSSTELERIARSASEMGLVSWAVRSSMQAWSSGGRVLALEGRSERVVVRIREEERLMRAVVRL